MLFVRGHLRRGVTNSLPAAVPSARLGKLWYILISNHAWLNTDILGSLNDAGDLPQCHLERGDKYLCWCLGPSGRG